MVPDLDHAREHTVRLGISTLAVNTLIDIQMGEHLDNLLWTFRAGSFIPHQLYTGEIHDFTKVILIGSLDAPEHWQKTIMNLSSQHPKNVGLAERIIEILDNSEEAKELGRNRYRHYQQSGAAITTHKIDQTS